MGRLFTTRRSEWLPGVAVLGAGVGLAAALGSVGVRHWALYAGLSALLLLLYGLARRRKLERRDASAAPRARAKPKAMPGTRMPYDLESDQSTDDQKYLM